MKAITLILLPLNLAAQWFAETSVGGTSRGKAMFVLDAGRQSGALQAMGTVAYETGTGIWHYGAAAGFVQDIGQHGDETLTIMGGYGYLQNKLGKLEGGNLWWPIVGVRYGMQRGSFALRWQCGAIGAVFGYRI